MTEVTVMDRAIAKELRESFLANQKLKAPMKMAHVCIKFSDGGKPEFEVSVSDVTAIMGTDFNWRGCRSSTEHVFWQPGMVGGKCCQLSAPVSIKATGFLWCPVEAIPQATAFLKDRYTQYLNERAKDAELIMQVSRQMAKDLEALDIPE